MQIFKQLSKKRYKHYYDGTIEELDNMDRNSPNLHSELMQVVMWLYKKHSLWIIIIPTVTGNFAYKVIDVQLNPEKVIERPPYKDVSAEDFSEPTDAYLGAIEDILNNLI